MKPICQLPEHLPADLRRMREEVDRFKKGDTTPAEFRSFRVPQGVYEERAEGSFMLRVRLPAGIVLPEQMHTLAAVSVRHGSGVLHVTTRQDIQVHAVSLDSICDALEELAASGLSTFGGGGNGVRNITSCHDAGVCALEIFDVRPWAAALTERLLENPDNFRLPRKYKIAFAGCRADCSGAIVNDLGFIAHLRDAVPGFSVYAGGGLGARSAVGSLLEEFIPAPDCFKTAEAVRRVFDAHGNRRNKNRARLRFLIDQIGFERFRKLYRAELEKMEGETIRPLHPAKMPAGDRRRGGKTLKENGAGDTFASWKARNVSLQKQDGLNSVAIALVLGDIDAATLEHLAAVTEEYGDGMLHTTQWQNLSLHGVSDAQLCEVHSRLAELGLADGPPEVIRNATSCTGAQTCKLGICLSRGMASAITGRLAGMEDDIAEMDGLKISVSGCPNSCGRHPVAHIGLYGGARRVEGRLTPQYTVQLGGRLGEGKTRLAETVDVLHARNVPDFVAEFLTAFRSSPHFPDYDAFLEDGGRDIAADVASCHKKVPSFVEDRNYYYDYGAEEQFSLAGRGPGECGAGVFDLIEVDIQSARDALAEDDLTQAAALAARALLVTRGEEARDNIGALTLFEKHFIDTGLVKGEAKEAVGRALASFQGESPGSAVDSAGVQALIDRVQKLYDGMDQSLKFDVSDAMEGNEAEISQEETPAPEIQSDREVDFRGVACPLNYVKTKMALSAMKPGQVLSVLVDEEGCRNVPQSVKKDGHEVLGVSPSGKHYRISIRKK